MSKSTIFGEENFFDPSMITLQYNNAVEKYVYDEFSMAVKMQFPNVSINKEKLTRWVKLCLHLDNIEYKELKDIALKKKISDLIEQRSLTEKALELACNDIYWLSYIGGDYTKEDFVKHKVDLYMKKAKEKMKNE